MIFQNQQANILRVNGALADNFANRPASQGTYYIFYSLDTQEIFYDDVSGWILLGSGGGGTPVNIYTSDGFIFTDRNVISSSVGTNALNFVNFGKFRFLAQGTINSIVYNLEIDLLQKNIFLGRYDINLLNQYTGFRITDISNIVKVNLGKFDNNSFHLVIDTTNSRAFFNIANINSSTPVGLDINHINRIYQFGQITGGNTNTLTINDSTNTITTTRGGQTRGFSLNLNSQNYGFGSFGGGNGTALVINDGNQIISTQSNAGVNGIVLNFNAQSYLFGHGSSGNRAQFLVDNLANIIQTRFNNTPNGLNIDGVNGIYNLGSISFSNNVTLQIENTNKRFVTFHNGGQINGFDIVISTDIYKFGRIQGNNTTNLTINDAAAFPVQINGTNVLQGTSGAVSGQHLKIKVNGVDYVIELKNP